MIIKYELIIYLSISCDHLIIFILIYFIYYIQLRLFIRLDRLRYVCLINAAAKNHINDSFTKKYLYKILLIIVIYIVFKLFQISNAILKK